MTKKLSTEAYKGTRDFYPEDMAIQRYIFDTWAKTAESFGFERYDASILEPSELYKSKGAENEEMVNEQTYTFIDRGDREVTLRPEMTPTVARMVAGRRRELSFPVRWYSIPNLFRYERPQRGRLREHWQLNCDIFGSDHYTADVEIIMLAYQTLIDLGATPSMFVIKINNRHFLTEFISKLAKEVGKKITQEAERDMIRILDRIDKMSDSEFEKEMTAIVGSELSEIILTTFKSEKRRQPIIESCAAYQDIKRIIDSLGEMGIRAEMDSKLARGFDYYTGTIFEIFDTDPKNNRSLIGGGRYDNLTSLFGGDAVTGIGFGMGDVTMRDFLETHNLLKGRVPVVAPTLIILPMDATFNLDGEKIAQAFRNAGVRVSVDIGTRKLGKKLGNASDAGAQYVLVVGDDEISSGAFTLKELANASETRGSVSELITHISM